MLVLSRKTGERIVIGDNITVVVNRIDGNRVSIGIEAPRDVRIVRGELPDAAEAVATDTAPLHLAALVGPTFDLAVNSMPTHAK